jgi:hypothetical protein
LQRRRQWNVFNNQQEAANIVDSFVMYFNTIHYWYQIGLFYEWNYF